MMIILAILLISIFSGLSLLHFYWFLGGRAGLLAAIPEIDGKPAFQPSAIATLVVAVGLALCGLLLAVTAGIFSLPLSGSVLSWLTRALALVLLLRAIGDFRLAGFFKRVRNSRFARLDTAVYSPLCLALAIGSAIIGFAAHT
jgi:hypothetical protein